MDEMVFLCRSSDLKEAGLAIPFDVQFEGASTRAFAVRHNDQIQAYLNRCAHIPMEMDFQANRFFDETGKWLLCATHGAVYSPSSGQCVQGPCRGNLIKISITEAYSNVYWHTNPKLKPIVF
jgi:nitrite reductase/ring-hydroxylating ferredoxin subunit